MVQVHIFYSGRVQGVGFRYTTVRYATDLGLKGWVRNLPDGRVEMVVAGAQEDIEKFQHNLEEHFGSYIKDKNQQIQDLPTTFKDFQVR